MAVKDQATNLKTDTALAPQSVGANTTVNGSAIATGDFQAYTFLALVGSYTDGDFEFKLQEADDDGTGSPDAATWADVANDDILNGDNVQSIAATGRVKLGYRGIKPHVRLVLTTTNVTSGATVAGAAIRGYGREGTFTNVAVT